MKEFPLYWHVCPGCGSEESIGKMLFGQEELEKLRAVSEDGEATASIKMVQVPIPGAGLVSGWQEMLILLYDFCAVCGREYLVKADRQTLPTKRSN